MITGPDTFFLRFLLRDMKEFIWFEVSRTDQERLQDILYGEPLDCKPFFSMDTLDGYQVTVALDAIQAVNFLWQYTQPEDSDRLAQQLWRKVADEDYRTDFHVCFRGRAKPMHFYSSEYLKLAEIGYRLDLLDPDENAFLPFQDEDDETVALQAKEITLVVIPKATLHTLAKEHPDYEELFGSDDGDVSDYADE